MSKGHILGFPRIGAKRELKFALESFWRGESDETHLRQTGQKLRQRHWQLQADAGLDFVSVGDFAYYDQMLTQTALFAALPKRFGFGPGPVKLADLFSAARGTATQAAMEMTKWFDTNYHYIVPELSAETRFTPSSSFLLDEVDEALALGFQPKPVLIGPLSYLYLSKSHVPGFDRLALLPQLIDAFRSLLEALAARGIEWVQIDEPCLGLDLEASWLSAYRSYAAFSGCGVKLLLATYFESVEDKIDLISGLPLEGVHIDLVRAPKQLASWCAALPQNWILSAGIIDGRNIWRTDLCLALSELEPARLMLGDRLWIAPSSSLLHCPTGLADEHQLDRELKSWLAFATEKLSEVASISCALKLGQDAIAQAVSASSAASASRKASRRVVNQLVQRHLAGVTETMAKRHSNFDVRIGLQQAHLNLPFLPTTTIGSFPQTPSIRQARAAFKRGELTALDYLERMREEIEVAVRRQEELGLDVLVHGEAERNDMVEYFGEQLWGYAFTDFGWVQSYGSRCVKPPIIYGDVYRPAPMTVETTVFAQSLTDRPMKGMLTGPVTMLQWSFVRDDQPRAITALQLALAIRGEVNDLEKAGITVIQIDEPALREGLPLRKRDWEDYLAWATRAFRISSSGVADTTQIHTHMCYAEFNDILPSIAAMDADVITIETSRSAMQLLDGFAAFAYPNEIGPGVYDIHSPRVPTQAAIEELLDRAAQVIPMERLWVNPDCGLKTRGWTETGAALHNMVQAAKALRQRHALAQDRKQRTA